jgi:hypothetical protein
MYHASSHAHNLARILHQQTEFEIKHLKWIVDNNNMFPEYTDSEFQKTQTGLTLQHHKPLTVLLKK